jgi:hypothetical protein
LRKTTASAEAVVFCAYFNKALPRVDTVGPFTQITASPEFFGWHIYKEPLSVKVSQHCPVA